MKGKLKVGLGTKKIPFQENDLSLKLYLNVDLMSKWLWKVKVGLISWKSLWYVDGVGTGPLNFSLNIIDPSAL